MSFPPDEEDLVPHCGHCLVPLVHEPGEGRPVWRCPECGIAAIVYHPDVNGLR